MRTKIKKPRTGPFRADLGTAEPGDLLPGFWDEWRTAARNGSSFRLYDGTTINATSAIQTRHLREWLGRYIDPALGRRNFIANLRASGLVDFTVIEGRRAARLMSKSERERRAAIEESTDQQDQHQPDQAQQTLAG
jgi:hypothetical protein